MGPSRARASTLETKVTGRGRERQDIDGDKKGVKSEKLLRNCYSKKASLGNEKFTKVIEI